MNKIDKTAAISMDKFYTNPEIALACYQIFVEYICKYCPTFSIVEPSAGDGAFIYEHVVGYDLHPEREDILQNDFLDAETTNRIFENLLFTPNVIGNPPFGKRGSLAIRFLNIALTKAKFVGFILPVQFRKYSCQNKILKGAKLVMDIKLPEDSFLLMGQPYEVRCCFQIWTLEDVLDVDLRIVNRPATSHPDFEMFQFNRTLEAEKFFDYEWDFAVVRQGYHDYSNLRFHKDECNRKQQWIFFKAKNAIILNRLKEIDFNKLSQKNTSTPGFGKADVVEEYMMMYG